MATTRLGSFLSSTTPTNKPTIPPAPPSSSLSSISFSSLPLHPSIHFHHLKTPSFSYSRQSLFSSSLHCPSNYRPTISGLFFTLFAVVDEESVFTEEDINGEDNATDSKDDDFLSSGEMKKQATPCELYVCNLPRSCDIAELVNLFKPFGTVLSVEVCRNPETGVSRGCGYVTMGSISSARKAIAALDRSDVEGREMRVRLSVDMDSGRRNPEFLNSGPTKFMVYESPYKLYVGNLPWSTSPEDLRNHFSQFGTVVSARVLFDRKGGKNRAYGFLSYSSAVDRDAAIALDGTEFNNRVLVVRKGLRND